MYATITLAALFCVLSSADYIRPDYGGYGRPIVERRMPQPCDMQGPATVTCTVTDTVVMTSTETIIMTMTAPAETIFSTITETQQCETQTITEQVTMIMTVTSTQTETQTETSTITEATTLTQPPETVTLPPDTITVTQPPEAVLPTAETQAPSDTELPTQPTEEKTLVITTMVTECASGKVINNSNKNTVIVAVVDKNMDNFAPNKKRFFGFPKRDLHKRRPCKYFLLQNDRLQPMDGHSVKSVRGLEEAVLRVQQDPNYGNVQDALLTDIPRVTFSGSAPQPTA